jgi:hypothetical protein
MTAGAQANNRAARAVDLEPTEMMPARFVHCGNLAINHRCIGNRSQHLNDRLDTVN